MGRREMQGGGREAKQRRKRGGSGGGSGCPGPRLHPPPEQTSSRSHRNGSGLPGAWAAPARRVRIFEGVRCVKGKNAARLSTGRGAVAGPGPGGGVSQSVLPPPVSATGHQALRPAWHAPTRAARGRTRRAAWRGPQGQAGVGEPVQSAVLRGGLAREPLPCQSLLRSDPRSSGSEGGRPRWSPDPSFPSRASGQDTGGR